VQKLRIRFAKRGRLRFTSHRDFQRAFERALRRAEIPMAYSQGFTPHPKVSYAGAAPTGAASEAEYLEISVTKLCDPGEVQQALDEALPPGLDIVMVSESEGVLADRLQASEWEVRLPDVSADALAAAVSAFLAETSIEVERVTNKGTRILDVRAAVVRIEAEPAEPDLRLIVRHQIPTVRPEDVLNGLRAVGGLPPSGPFLATRVVQGVLDEVAGTITAP
jgi:radical SAM-linked protein